MLQHDCAANAGMGSDEISGLQDSNADSFNTDVGDLGHSRLASAFRAKKKKINSIIKNLGLQIADCSKRKSFGELFWSQRKNFQMSGGYKIPMKTRRTISTTEIFPLWTPFFSGKKSSALEQGGVCFLFPSVYFGLRELISQLPHFSSLGFRPLCFLSKVRGNLNRYTKRPLQDSAVIFCTRSWDGGICVSLDKSLSFLQMSATPRVENPQIFLLENAICCMS